MTVRTASVVVIGGGQAGLSAAHHLARRGFTSALTGTSTGRTFVVLDAAVRAGGAWQHRWESLRMATVNGIFALPGAPTPPFDPEEPSRTAVPRYFAAYEAAARLPILRPVQVHAVRRADADPSGQLVIETDGDQWRASMIINATGTWDAPPALTASPVPTFCPQSLTNVVIRATVPSSRILELAQIGAQIRAASGSAGGFKSHRAGVMRIARMCSHLPHESRSRAPTNAPRGRRAWTNSCSHRKRWLTR